MICIGQHRKNFADNSRSSCFVTLSVVRHWPERDVRVDNLTFSNELIQNIKLEMMLRWHSIAFQPQNKIHVKHGDDCLTMQMQSASQTHLSILLSVARSERRERSRFERERAYAAKLLCKVRNNKSMNKQCWSRGQTMQMQSFIFLMHLIDLILA